MHIEDLLIIWSKLCPECNYLKLLEVVCHLAKFRDCMPVGYDLCKCALAWSPESSKIMNKLLRIHYEVKKQQQYLQELTGAAYLTSIDLLH